MLVVAFAALFTVGAAQEKCDPSAPKCTDPQYVCISTKLPEGVCVARPKITSITFMGLPTVAAFDYTCGLPKDTSFDGEYKLSGGTWNYINEAGNIRLTQDNAAYGPSQQGRWSFTPDGCAPMISEVDTLSQGYSTPVADPCFPGAMYGKGYAPVVNTTAAGHIPGVTCVAN